MSLKPTAPGVRYSALRYEKTEKGRKLRPSDFVSINRGRAKSESHLLSETLARGRNNSPWAVTRGRLFSVLISQVDPLRFVVRTTNLDATSSIILVYVPFSGMTRRGKFLSSVFYEATHT